MSKPSRSENQPRFSAKRLLDLVLSGLILLLLWPLLLGIALLVYLAFGAPVIFRQVRPGRCGEPFVMFKFRTMDDRRDAAGQLLPDEQRLTAFGRLLRSTSLDELPELINVIRGEMSLVGPRPLLVEYLPHYSAEQARRHEVLPGITGWAQVNGRNGISWDEKFRHDVWYVDHQSVALDLKILAMTVYGVLRREGISAEGYVSMPYFTGSSDQREQRS